MKKILVLVLLQLDTLAERMLEHNLIIQRRGSE